MDPKTRRLVKLTITSSDNVNNMMDGRLSKKNAEQEKNGLKKEAKL